MEPILAAPANQPFQGQDPDQERNHGPNNEFGGGKTDRNASASTNMMAIAAIGIDRRVSWEIYSSRYPAVEASPATCTLAG